MATADQSENKTKVLVNVYEPVIAIMKRKFDAACLKRDAYLDKALRIEAGLLREEVTTPNSDKAKTYIAENLKQLRLKQLNLLLSTETVELMNDVCKEKNIPRDAFINRVFLLLIASDTVIDVLFLSLFEKLEESYGYGINYWDDNWVEWKNETGREYIYMFDRSNIIDSIECYIEVNPFWKTKEVFFIFFRVL